MVISTRQNLWSLENEIAIKWKSPTPPLWTKLKQIFYIVAGFFAEQRKNPSTQIVMAAAKYKKKYTNISGSEWNVLCFFVSLLFRFVTKTLEREAK